MNQLWEFLIHGVGHILDPNGLDHFYFILSFSLLYTLAEWKRVATLVTAFTLGHSLTLVLTILDILPTHAGVIETLIPITILVTCIKNFVDVFRGDEVSRRSRRLSYGLLVFFGLIHGMGFSFFLRDLFFEGESIVWPLLGFNVGIEVAQLLIVLAFISVLSLLNFTKTWKKSFLLAINTVLTILVAGMLF